MDIILLLKALILGVVEGLTEFLPISSTGHLILAGDLLNFNDDRGKLFEIVIQSGAILAVVWEFRERIRSTFAGLGHQREANRLVLNRIDARFVFDHKGLIVRHRDVFDFWAWSRQALGTPGTLLGWTPFLRAKVRTQANANLQKYLARQAA